MLSSKIRCLIVVVFSSLLVVAARADETGDQLLADDFEAPLFDLRWQLIEAQWLELAKEGVIDGLQSARVQVPTTLGEDVVMCTDVPGTVVAHLGLWVDLSALQLAVGSNFKLLNLAPDIVGTAVAGVRLRQQVGGLEIRAFMRDQEMARVQSAWYPLRAADVAAGPLMIRNTWRAMTTAEDPKGSFLLEVFRPDTSLVLSVALEGVENQGHEIGYARFGLIGTGLVEGSGGHLLIDELQLQQDGPVAVEPPNSL